MRGSPMTTTIRSIACALTCALGLSGCCDQPARPLPLRLDPPAELMRPPPDLSPDRLRRILGPST